MKRRPGRPLQALSAKFHGVPHYFGAENARAGPQAGSVVVLAGQGAARIQCSMHETQKTLLR